MTPTLAQLEAPLTSAHLQTPSPEPAPLPHPIKALALSLDTRHTLGSPSHSGPDGVTFPSDAPEVSITPVLCHLG